MKYQSQNIASQIEELKAVPAGSGPIFRLLHKESVDFWPAELTPFVFAVAALQIVLLNSNKAYTAYRDIARAWDMPGFQDVERLAHSIDGCFSSNKDAVAGFAAIMTLLHVNDDLKYAHSRIRELITIGFNSEMNLKNGIIKVNPDEPDTIFLIAAIMIYSKRDHDHSPLSQFTWLREYPSTRKGRAARASTLRSLKGDNSRLHHNDSLLDIANHWYQSRVVYSGPEEYCRKHYDKAHVWFEPTNVTRDIAIVDLATGYQRNWHK